MGSPVYDVHPGVAMVRKWADELPAKTGRSLEEWAEAVRGCGLADPKARRAWLKAEHGLGTNTAFQIVEYANDRMTWDGDPAVYLRNAAAYVDALFAGAKAHLRQVFEAVVAEVRALGADVKVCPCKTIVPFYRNHVFAECRPATRTRLELALAIGTAKPTGRVVPNPRADAKDRLKHLIPLTSTADIDAEVRKWLRVAYHADG